MYFLFCLVSIDHIDTFCVVEVFLENPELMIKLPC